MAVELMAGHGGAALGAAAAGEEERSLQRAASAGIESVEKLLRLFSGCSAPESDVDIGAVAGAAVGEFKKVISLLDRTRTGHARFRKAPLVQKKLETEQGPAFPVRRFNPDSAAATISFAASPEVSQAVSSFTGSVSMSSGFQFTQRSGVSSAGKPPLSSSRRKCGGASFKCGSASGNCHCSSKRKTRAKRVTRVAAISAKMADIPADDYSWRKYGQKPIKGSPHPRGYYKCSSVRGCPARKHVERATDDPNMLVVTYEGDHSHTDKVNDVAAVSLVPFESCQEKSTGQVKSKVGGEAMWRL